MAYTYAAPINLLDHVTADTVGDSVGISRAGSRTVVVSDGGLGFNTGIITIQLSIDQTDWVTITNDDASVFEVTAPAAFEIVWLGVGQFIRATLAGATSAVDLSVSMY